MNYEKMWNELKGYLKDAYEGKDNYESWEVYGDMLAMELIESGGYGKTGPERVAEAIKKDRGGDAAPTVQGWA